VTDVDGNGELGRLARLRRGHLDDDGEGPPEDARKAALRH
jgi:hypothetical protein